MTRLITEYFRRRNWMKNWCHEYQLTVDTIDTKSCHRRKTKRAFWYISLWSYLKGKNYENQFFLVNFNSLFTKIRQYSLNNDQKIDFILAKQPSQMWEKPQFKDALVDGKYHHLQINKNAKYSLWEICICIWI